MKIKYSKLEKNSYFVTWLSVLLSVLLFLILNLAFELATAPDGIVITRWNRTFPFYERINSPSTLELESSFILNSERKNLAIVFPKVIANRLEVYVNTHFIGAFGDRTGNIWPKALIQELPEWVLKEKNELKIILYGTVGYGISYYPYITKSSRANVKALMIEILRNDISLIAFGAAVIISYVLLFAFTIVDTPDRKMYLNVGLAMIIMIFSLIQFVYRETSGTLFVYLTFEKIALVFPIFGLTLIYFGLNESIPRKVPKFRRVVLIVSSLTFAAGLFLSNRIKTINILFSLIELYALLLVFLTLFLIIRYKMVHYYLPIIFLSLTSLQTLYVLITNSPDELMVVYGRIFFSLYIGTFTIWKFKNISETKKFLEQENLVDKLTGAFNRKIIDYIKPGGTLIIMDLDNFKEINDKYGHMYGDDLLKRFADVVKQHIRQGEDYFIRLGGDEFCIITNSLDVEAMIKRIYNTSKNELGLSFSYGYAPMKDFDEAYAVADKTMYEKKALLKKQK